MAPRVASDRAESGAPAARNETGGLEHLTNDNGEYHNVIVEMMIDDAYFHIPNRKLLGFNL